MHSSRPLPGPFAQARRHWWLVLLMAGAGLGTAALYTAWQPTVYESSTSVLVEPVGTSAGHNAARADVNLDTESQLVTSTAVATRAAGLLHSTTPPAGLAAAVSVGVPANTSVLVITFDAARARDAQAGSRAFAQAYLGNRTDSARADLAGGVAVLTDKVNQLDTSLAQVNAALAGTGARNPDRPALDTQRSTIVSQINTLTDQLDGLSTTTVEAGRIIQDAGEPATPARPDKLLDLACGGPAGLALGIGAALTRERLGRRIHGAAALSRRVDVPAIATIPVRTSPLDGVFPPGDAAGRAFDRLRNEVVALMPAAAVPVARHALIAVSPGAGGGTGDARPVHSGAVIVVAGASGGAASAVVAANLAAAFARTGAETVVVSARLADGPEHVAYLERVLGVHPRPGLSDVLDGQLPLRRTVQRAPEHPYLTVIGAGGTVDDRCLLQSRVLPDILATLRARAAYVVLEAPSTATSADAQGLASLADATLVAVELRRTRYTEVGDAAEQLRRIGTPLLGVVVLPRLPRWPAEP